jgi:hypothetical protein
MIFFILYFDAVSWEYNGCIAAEQTIISKINLNILIMIIDIL